MQRIHAQAGSHPPSRESLHGRRGGSSSWQAAVAQHRLAVLHSAQRPSKLCAYIERLGFAMNTAYAMTHPSIHSRVLKPKNGAAVYDGTLPLSDNDTNRQPSNSKSKGSQVMPQSAHSRMRVCTAPVLRASVVCTTSCCLRLRAASSCRWWLRSLWVYLPELIDEICLCLAPDVADVE